VVRSAACAIAIAVAASDSGGCADVDTFSGDAFPIQYTSRGGAITLEVSQPGADPQPAVLELLSPLTVLDPGPAGMPRRRSTTLTVRGATPTGSVPRAALTGMIIETHPCQTETCGVGDPASPFPVTAIIGADLVAGDAVRLDFLRDRMFILPDIAGDASTRTGLCEGVFPSPFFGAGTLIVDSAEVSFTSRRMVVGACLGPDTSLVAPSAKRGGDTLLAIATGLGASILTEAAYLRYRDATLASVPALDTLPVATFQLISGPVTGRLARIPAVSLVGSSREPRGPCRDSYAHTFLSTANPDNVCPVGLDCPCADVSSCGAPAVVALAPFSGVSFVVVPDDDPLLQSLRAELRPLQGEVDGILGTDALAATQVDVDYPGDRLLWRCASNNGCQVRPLLDGLDEQIVVNSCLASPPVIERERGGGGDPAAPVVID
jgi:hypothetical protein